MQSSTGDIGGNTLEIERVKGGHADMKIKVREFKNNDLEGQRRMQKPGRFWIFLDHLKRLMI
jgi:hypothetical protein